MALPVGRGAGLFLEVQRIRLQVCRASAGDDSIDGIKGLGGLTRDCHAARIRDDSVELREILRCHAKLNVPGL